MLDQDWRSVCKPGNGGFGGNRNQVMQANLSRKNPLIIYQIRFSCAGISQQFDNRAALRLGLRPGKAGIDDTDNRGFHHFDMPAPLRDVDTTIKQLPVKEGMTKEKIADHDGDHNAEHCGKGKFIAHGHFKNDYNAGNRRADHGAGHCCHATDGQCRRRPYDAERGDDPAANGTCGGPYKKRR